MYTCSISCVGTLTTGVDALAALTRWHSYAIVSRGGGEAVGGEEWSWWWWIGRKRGSVEGEDEFVDGVNERVGSLGKQRADEDILG